ncbi:MAG: hypothetical protein DDT32_00648 [Syntrophomonadaceae bacterium]|nr:hypothetical protein [Bacillota bacterium]MBT9146901.1 hypothetical protein [Bacillota bacterium]
MVMDSYHPAFLVDVDTDIEMLTFEAPEGEDR